MPAATKNLAFFMPNTLKLNHDKTDILSFIVSAYTLFRLRSPFVSVRKAFEQPELLKSRCLVHFFTISGEKQEGEKPCMPAVINQGPDPESIEVNRKVSIDVSKRWDGPPELHCMLTTSCLLSAGASLGKFQDWLGCPGFLSSHDG